LFKINTTIGSGCTKVFTGVSDDAAGEELLVILNKGGKPLLDDSQSLIITEQFLLPEYDLRVGANRSAGKEIEQNGEFTGLDGNEVQIDS